MVNSFTDDEITHLDTAVIASSSLSVLGSSLIVITFCIFKDVRKELGAQLIFFLNLSDLLMSLSWFPYWKPANTNALCIIQASALQYFEVSSILWGFCIGITLVLFFNREDISPRMFLYHCFCWVVPIPVVGICLYLQLFGVAGGAWCWVREPQSRLLVYTPSLFIALANFIIFIYLIYKSSAHSAIYVLFRRKIFAYLFASCICVLAALANRIQNIVQPDHQIFTLFMIQAILQPLQGFINSLVYGLTDEHYYAQYLKWGVFRRLAPSTLSVHNTTEDYQPLALDFDYDGGGSYRSFDKLDSEVSLSSSGTIQ